ncbi:glycosyltransferase [Candidatus Woesearchaeota archaeon]|nr:glycosyltransferase [Candidatus Woesearchaeota archaeon]
MRVLMLGNYDETYSRGRILQKGLKKQRVNVDVLMTSSYPTMATRLLHKDFDVILATGKFTLLTAWLMKWWHRRKIVFDAFISDYDTLVQDRRLVSPWSPKAGVLWFGDKCACHLADHVILDTQEHIDYFVKTFRVPKKKFSVVLVGADDDVFKPMQKAHRGFLVSFDGTYIPLQGVEYILQAAKLLEKEPIRFQLLGKGQTYESMRLLADTLKLTNVTFKPSFVPLEKLAELIAPADVGLGIFGTTDKAQRVIPNKVYHLLAMDKPVITADTPAIRRLFTHKKDAFLVPAGNPQALADAITTLQKDAPLRNRIAKEGYALFKQQGSIAAVGKQLLTILKAHS